MIMSVLVQVVDVVQVGLALPSDSVVLVQLADGRKVNYTSIHQSDHDYRDFMTLMRNEQTNLRYLYEYGVYSQRQSAIYGKTSGILEPPTTDLHYTNVLACNIRPVIADVERELSSPVKCDCIVTPHFGADHDYALLVRYATKLAGCGNIGQSRTKYLHHAILYAYDLHILDGKRKMSFDDLQPTNPTACGNGAEPRSYSSHQFNACLSYTTLL